MKLQVLLHKKNQYLALPQDIMTNKLLKQNWGWILESE